MAKPVERKVYAGTLGAGAGGVLGTFVVWGTGLFFGGSATAEAVKDTIAAVPAPVSALELFIVAAAGSFAAGYKAKSEA